MDAERPWQRARLAPGPISACNYEGTLPGPISFGVSGPISIQFSSLLSLLETKFLCHTDWEKVGSFSSDPTADAVGSGDVCFDCWDPAQPSHGHPGFCKSAVVRCYGGEANPAERSRFTGRTHDIQLVHAIPLLASALLSQIHK
ncbi:hypothetical protein DUI87_17480 [Hirundo rustica rustica]|uniref:Uncharacterized protein n=1 Tax=Hirundo rustica rustica TaxID=333673 RepID=A0A3M0JYN2_HIRRU|nr:hypothetical protein DUI87_17480 [Hirundo rustica rustica]